MAARIASLSTLVRGLAREAGHRIRYVLVCIAGAHPRRASALLASIRLGHVVRLRVALYRAFAWPLADDFGMRMEVATAGGRMLVDTVTVLNVAAGAGQGTATLYQSPRANAGASSVSLDAPVVGRRKDYVPTEVRVAAVDALVPPELFQRVRVIKVDTEGHELEVLRGAEQVLAAGAPVALFVEVSPEWSGGDPASFFDDLCRRHGLMTWLLSNEYSLEGCFPSRLKPPRLMYSLPPGRCDVLLVRDLDVEPTARRRRSPR